MIVDTNITDYLDTFYIIGIDLPIINFKKGNKYSYYRKNFRKLKDRYAVSKNEQYFVAESLQFHFFNKKTQKSLFIETWEGVEKKCTFYSSIKRYERYVEATYNECKDVIYSSKLSKNEKFETIFKMTLDYFENEMIPNERIFLYSYLKDNFSVKAENFHVFNLQYEDIEFNYNSSEKDEEIVKKINEYFRVAIVDDYFVEELILIKKSDFDNYINENRNNLNKLSKAFYSEKREFELSNFKNLLQLKKANHEKKQKSTKERNINLYNRLKVGDEVITKYSLSIGIITKITENKNSKTFTVVEDDPKRTFKIRSRDNYLNIRLKSDAFTLYSIKDWKAKLDHFLIRYDINTMIALGGYSMPLREANLFTENSNLLELIRPNLSDIYYNYCYQTDVYYKHKLFPDFVDRENIQEPHDFRTDYRDEFIKISKLEDKFVIIKDKFETGFRYFTQNTNSKVPYFLNKFKIELEKNKQETIILIHNPVTENEIELKETDSKLLGTPFLPKDFEYPKDDSGKLMKFFAQINFEQMPELSGFPNTGILQFYFGDKWYEDSEIKAIYHKNINSEIETNYDFLKEIKNNIPVKKECRIQAISDFDYGELVCRGNIISEKYNYKAFGDSGERESELFTDFFTCSYNKMGGDIFVVNDIVPGLNNDDVLLLQLVTDFNNINAISILDAGTMQFYIKKNDLIDQNFDNVLVKFSYY